MAGFNRALSASKQAGVGLLLGEQEESKAVTVKQVVPRGSADRAGKVKIGDQILRVGGSDLTGVGVTEMRNLIIGEQGTSVRVTFRNPSSGEVYDLDLIRGTPDYFDALQGGGSSQPPPAGVSLYASGNRIPTLNRYMLGTSWSAEMFANMPPPQATQVDQTPQRALQEENEWLRSALRMAESTIMRNRQELSSMRDIYDKNEVEQDSRIKEIEKMNREKDDEKREVEQQMLQAERYRRSLEARLAEAQRRTEWQRESEHQIQDNERARMEYLNEIKRRAEEEKRYLEMDLMRSQEELRAERAMRLEAEAREASFRNELQRVNDYTRPASGGFALPTSAAAPSMGRAFN
uniref:PDZ domain-containing protein n=1 Tax=Hanusia phi TaxID=3032 RepID=A0A7S0EZ37_9CRYP|mmetsp:Transcript_33789/g.75910  ORF Transcript_33789/g.75910 Transcript_33789/m.75910 type:complete len:349 (+) Transcript_33789:63-1109(+)